MLMLIFFIVQFIAQGVISFHVRWQNDEKAEDYAMWYTLGEANLQQWTNIK